MAFIDQKRKAIIAALIKPILKKYGIKATLSIHNHTSLALNIKEGPIDFIKNFNDVVPPVGPYGGPASTDIQVNVYHYENHFSGLALAFLKEAIPCLYEGNHDNSDIQTDYFDVGWYVNVNIGKWNKPYRRAFRPHIYNI